MVSSSDVNEKKGGILAIVSLLCVDVGNTNAEMSSFANYLRNLLPSQDVVVMELAARAVGKLTLVSFINPHLVIFLRNTFAKLY